MKHLHLIVLFIFSFNIVNSQAVISDKVDFENKTKIQEYIKLDTNQGNIWRIGNPQKTILNTAYSGNEAIITDLEHYYPPSNKSSFIMKFFPKQKILEGIIVLKGFYKIDSDSLKDYGIIEMSIDKGFTWYNLFDNIYGEWGWGIDSIYKIPIFTGRVTDTWHPFSFMTSYTYAKDAMDSLYFRFLFITDSIDNKKEGWMIDDIEIWNYGPGKIDEKTEEIYNILIYPNPAEQSDKIIIETQNRIYAKINIYDINGLIVKEIIKPNETTSINISNLKLGIYYIKLFDIHGYNVVKRLIII